VTAHPEPPHAPPSIDRLTAPPEGCVVVGYGDAGRGFVHHGRAYALMADGTWFSGIDWRAALPIALTAFEHERARADSAAVAADLHHRHSVDARKDAGDLRHKLTAAVARAERAEKIASAERSLRVALDALDAALIAESAKAATAQQAEAMSKVEAEVHAARAALRALGVER
jgi:hypothetical protein